ncbi:MAG: hypothetical protein NZL90_03685, partial [Aquificaceae bacterium]|nr:hypothetical protein [Aquificaceae bacterium]
MSKRHLILASAVLSMSALVASCGGGGGGNPPQQQPPAPQPPATPPATPPAPSPAAKSLVATVLIQTQDPAATNFDRRLVDVFSDGSAEVSPLTVDEAAPNKLTFVHQCANGNVFMTETRANSHVWFYKADTKSIVKVSTTPGQYNLANTKAEFLVFNDTARPGSVELIVTCAGQAVDVSTVDTTLDADDNVQLANNYVIYMDDTNGAATPDKLYIFTLANPTLVHVANTRGASAGQDWVA